MRVCVRVCVTDQRSPAPLRQDLHDHDWASCEERRLEMRREARKDEGGKQELWQKEQRPDEDMRSNKMRKEQIGWDMKTGENNESWDEIDQMIWEKKT